MTNIKRIEPMNEMKKVSHLIKLIKKKDNKK